MYVLLENWCIFLYYNEDKEHICVLNGNRFYVWMCVKRILLLFFFWVDSLSFQISRVWPVRQWGRQAYWRWPTPVMSQHCQGAMSWRTLMVTYTCHVTTLSCGCVDVSWSQWWHMTTSLSSPCYHCHCFSSTAYSAGYLPASLARVYHHHPLGLLQITTRL